MKYSKFPVLYNNQLTRRDTSWHETYYTVPFIEGKELGLQQGREEGFLQGKLDVARTLMAYRTSVEEAAKIIGISVSELSTMMD